MPFTEIFYKKRHPPVPQSEKVLTRFSQVGAQRSRLGLSEQCSDLAYRDRHTLPNEYCGLRILRFPYTAGVNTYYTAFPEKMQLYRV